MSVKLNIITSYDGQGTKRALTDLQTMEKQAKLAGQGVTAGMLNVSRKMSNAANRMSASARARARTSACRSPP